MGILASAVVNDARIILNDVAGTRYTNPEMLIWVNAGRRDMAALRPSVWNKTAKRTVTLASGAYQKLDELGVSDASSLMDVICNVSGTTPTSTIRLIERSQLDNFKPSWRSETGKEVQHWFKDEANHFGFWIYPSVTGGKIDVNVAVAPVDLGTLEEVCVPIDVLATTLMHYLLFRAYSKEDEASAQAKAQAYLQLFTAALAQE